MIEAEQCPVQEITTNINTTAAYRKVPGNVSHGKFMW